MRFLCLMAMVLCVLNAQAESFSSAGASEKQQKIVELMNYIGRAKEQAEKQLPEEASLINHGDKYNFLSPFYLMQTDASPLSGTKGYGQWTSLPFGRVRLISCYSGIQYDKNIFAGLQIDLNKGVLLKKPHWTTPLSPESKVQLLYPIRHPLPVHKTKTDSYAGSVIFPVLATAPNTPTPFDLALDVTLTGCEDTTCHTVTVPVSLILESTEQFSTGICPLMMAILQDVPVPYKKKVTVSARQNNAGDIQLAFDFTQPTAELAIQIDNDFSFKELSKHITPKTALVTIRPDTTVSPGTLLNLKIITSFGLFDMPTSLEHTPFQVPGTTLPWTTIFWGGTLLLLFTPLWPLFWLEKPTTVAATRTKAKQTVVALSLMTFLTGVAWQLGLLTPIDFVQTSWLFVLILLVILIDLIRRPPLTLMAVLILFWVVPKPYLDNAFVPHITEAFWMVCWWGAVAMLPFIWVYKYPATANAFRRFLSKTPRPVYWIARLPMIGLFIWLAVASFGNLAINHFLPVYTPETLKAGLDDNKIVFVSVEKPVCFTCFWNKAIQMNFGYAHSFVRRNKLVRLYAPLDSADGQMLQRALGQTTTPLNILYGPTNKNGILLPPLLDYFDLKAPLNAVK